MTGSTDEPIWPSQRHRAHQRHLANQRLVATHRDSGTCECCRPGHGCAALDRAVRELSETPATNR